MSWQRWAAVALGVAGVAVLAGPGWALLAAAGPAALLPLPGVPAGRLAGDQALGRVLGAVRRLGAATAAWASVWRTSAVVTPAGVVLAAVGVAVWAGIGPALLVAGAAGVGLGLMLGWNQAPDPAR